MRQIHRNLVQDRRSQIVDQFVCRPRSKVNVSTKIDDNQKVYQHDGEKALRRRKQGEVSVPKRNKSTEKCTATLVVIE